VGGGPPPCVPDRHDGSPGGVIDRHGRPVTVSISRPPSWATRRRRHSGPPDRGPPTGYRSNSSQAPPQGPTTPTADPSGNTAETHDWRPWPFPTPPRMTRAASGPDPTPWCRTEGGTHEPRGARARRAEWWPRPERRSLAGRRARPDTQDPDYLAQVDGRLAIWMRRSPGRGGPSGTRPRGRRPLRPPPDRGRQVTRRRRSTAQAWTSPGPDPVSASPRETARRRAAWRASGHRDRPRGPPGAALAIGRGVPHVYPRPHVPDLAYPDRFPR
jgi:hypothetical protein